MGIRRQVGERLDTTLGKQRTDRIRSAERRARTSLAHAIAPAPEPAAKPRKAAAAGRPAPAAPAPRRAKPAEPRIPMGEPNDRQTGWIPSDPFVPHPPAKLSRHDLLRELHGLLAPRTYFEIGVNTGASLMLSRSRTIAVDPEFLVRQPIRCDLDLVRAKSDDYFARDDAMASFDGVPVDLAFIDGMHLSEFAYRDYYNVEPHLAPTGVTVFDDVLPRNALEAARDRLTGAWAGDVYKAVEVIARHRPDLVVILVNTLPTGTAVVVGSDPSSTTLRDVYPSELSYFEKADPQTPPQEYMARTAAVDPEVLLASEAWPLLVEARESGDRTVFDKAVSVLRSLPTLG